MRFSDVVRRLISPARWVASPQLNLGRRVRAVWVALLAGLAVLALSGCTGSDGTSESGAGANGTGENSAGDAGALHIVTTEESQRLAVMRFNNFDAGARAISFDATESGVDYRVTGWYDYVSHTGYGVLTDDAESSTLIIWSPSLFGVHLGGAAALTDGQAPTEVPDVDTLDTAWSGGPLDPTGSVLHAVLAAIAGLGSDRPDNPLLVQQSGALYLGTGTVDGVSATHFAGPPADEPTTITEPAELLRLSHASYWLSDANLLLRAELRVGGGAHVTTVDFGDAGAMRVPSPFPDDGVEQ